MAIVGRAKYTHTRARNFEKTRREGSVASPRNFARARVFRPPHKRSPKLEATRSLCRLRVPHYLVFRANIHLQISRIRVARLSVCFGLQH